MAEQTCAHKGSHPAQEANQNWVESTDTNLIRVPTRRSWLTNCTFHSPQTSGDNSFLLRKKSSEQKAGGKKSYEQKMVISTAGGTLLEHKHKR